MSQDGSNVVLRVVLIRPDETVNGMPLIAPSPRLEVVAELAMNDNAMRDLEQLRPNVVVVDCSHGNSIIVGNMVSRVRALSPLAKVIAICCAGDECMATKALTSGAAACLTSNTDALSVLRAVNDVSRGRMHLSPTGQRAIRRALASPLYEAATD